MHRALTSGSLGKISTQTVHQWNSCAVIEGLDQSGRIVAISNYCINQSVVLQLITCKVLTARQGVLITLVDQECIGYLPASFPRVVFVALKHEFCFISSARRSCNAQVMMCQNCSAAIFQILNKRNNSTQQCQSVPCPYIDSRHAGWHSELLDILVG